MYTIIYLKRKPTSFSSDFALALSICLCFYFYNICIHVGIYCCLMSHTSMITSEISHRFGRVQLKNSFFFFFSVWSFFSDLAKAFLFFCLFGVFLRTKIPGVFFKNSACTLTIGALARMRLHLLSFFSASLARQFVCLFRGCCFFCLFVLFLPQLSETRTVYLAAVLQTSISTGIKGTIYSKMKCACFSSGLQLFISLDQGCRTYFTPWATYSPL